MKCPQLELNEVAEEQTVSVSELRTYAENAGVPKRFLDATFENTQNICTQKVKDFVEFGKGVLILMGTNGTGKTRLACAAINKRIRNRKNPGMYISCNYEVCPLIRSSRSFRAEKSEYDVLQEFYTTPFLVLDEIGKGDDSVISKMFVTCVLAARYDNNLPTLITTNLDKNGLAEFVGQDISSRFKETAMIGVLAGNDMRGAN